MFKVQGIIPTDINLFWQVFDETNPKIDLNIFEEKNLKAGSDGFEGFIKMIIEIGKILRKNIIKNFKLLKRL